MTNEIQEGMIAFDLEKALAGWKCKARYGKLIGICFFNENDEYILVGTVELHDCYIQIIWDKNGCSKNRENLHLDLFLEKKTKTYWHNIYKYERGDIYLGGKAYKTEKEAKDEGEDFTTYLKTSSFELDDIEAEPAKPKTKKLWIAIGKESSLNCHYTSNAYPLLKDLKILDINKYWIKEIEVESDE